MALATNLAHYYNFDESSGNASDSVGSLTLTNVNTVPFATAKINNGVTGDGVSKYFANTTTSPLTYAELGSQFSVSCWVKRIGNPAGASYVYRIQSNDGGGNYRHIILYYYSAGGWHINTVAGDSAVTYPETGNLDLLVLTYNAGTFKFYVNGSQSGSNITLSVGSTASALPNSFGVLNDPATGAPFNVQVDELGVWSRELSSSEVTSLYNSSIGFAYPFFTSTATINTIVTTA